MNIRKNIDYTDMYAALDSAMVKNLSQVELYYEIGRAVCQRTEKGAAVAAAAYLSEQYPDIQGFSPRNLRRMRDFCRTYKDHPDLLTLALQLGWTQNVVILEADLTMKLRTWYLKAVLQFGWSKAELLDKIANQAHESIILAVQPTACDHGKTGRSAQADNPYKSSFSRYRLFQWKNPCTQYGSIPDVYDRLLLIPLCVCLRPMNRPPWMLGRGINGGELQHPIPSVHNIVPRSARYQHRIPHAETPPEGHLIPALSHTNGGLTLLYTNHLICVWMELQTDFAPERNTHHCQLQMIPRPKRSSEILVLPRYLPHIYGKGDRSRIGHMTGAPLCTVRIHN